MSIFRVEYQNTISSIAFRQTALLGNLEDNKAYDKAEAFIVRLQKFESSRSEDRLIGLLSTLFTVDLSPLEKKEVISRDFGIPVTEHIERMVANMCNYSSYVRNHAYKDGMQRGMRQGASEEKLSNIRSLIENTGWSAQKAMDTLNVSPAEQAKYAAML